MDISGLRLQIDSIDEKLLDLFIQRMSVSAEIAAYKAERNLPVHVPQREKEIIDKVSNSSPEALVPYVSRLYEQIFTLSREYQQQYTKE